jgi:hypothetical protein
MLIVFTPLSKRDGQKTYTALKKWFKNNPNRRICVTDLGKVRKSHIKDDLLKFCVDGTKLKD